MEFFGEDLLGDVGVVDEEDALVLGGLCLSLGEVDLGALLGLDDLAEVDGVALAVGGGEHDADGLEFFHGGELAAEGTEELGLGWRMSGEWLQTVECLR